MKKQAISINPCGPAKGGLCLRFDRSLEWIGGTSTRTCAKGKRFHRCIQD
jgi:hypothetical protein